MKLFLMAVVLIFQGCAYMPAVIENAPDSHLKYRDVVDMPETHIGKPVRWGGVVIDVENEATMTRIQMLYYPLDSQGRPKVTGEPEGRFLLESSRFLDPAVYRNDSELTLAGDLIGEAVRKVGNKALKIPVVATDNIHLWPSRRTDGCPYPYYYPYRYFPYYGIYPYGFYGP